MANMGAFHAQHQLLIVVIAFAAILAFCLVSIGDALLTPLAEFVGRPFRRVPEEFQQFQM